MRDERPAPAHHGEERRVQPRGASRQHADDHLDAVRAQVGEAARRRPAGSDPRSRRRRGGCRRGDHAARTGRCGRCGSTARACSTASRRAPARRRPRSARTLGVRSAGDLVRARGRRPRPRRRRRPRRPSGSDWCAPRRARRGRAHGPCMASSSVAFQLVRRPLSSPFLLEQRVDVLLRRERDQVVDAPRRRRRSGSAASDRWRSRRRCRPWRCHRAW